MQILILCLDHCEFAIFNFYRNQKNIYEDIIGGFVIFGNNECLQSFLINSLKTNVGICRGAFDIFMNMATD